MVFVKFRKLQITEKKKLKCAKYIIQKIST